MKEIIEEIVPKLKDFVCSLSGSLMEKPDKDLTKYRVRTNWGRSFKTNHPEHGDPHYWYYPSKEIEAKVDDDKLYKVWYSVTFAHDPMDGTTWNTVHYIRETSQLEMKLVKGLTEILEELG